MACNEIEVSAKPEAVWAVLADGHRYAEWVVGAQEIRDADDTWPKPGSCIHHTVGIGPLRLRDETEVVEADPNRKLVLEAKTRPFGVARIVLDLRAEGDATRVVMLEGPVSPLAQRVHGFLFDAALRKRNDEALRRLKDLAEEGA